MVRTVPEGLAKKSAPDAAVLRFEKEVNVDNLEAFLLEDGELDAFARALKDPAYSRMSLVHLIRRFNVPLSRLQEIYSNGMKHLGLIRMSTALPEIMAHVSEDAKSRDIICSYCDGTRTVKLPNPSDSNAPAGASKCPICKGKGTQSVPGDKHARDLVFESMKLTNQGGPLVAIQQNFKGNDDDNMASMFKMTQQITVGQKESEAE